MQRPKYAFESENPKAHELVTANRSDQNNANINKYQSPNPSFLHTLPVSLPQSSLSRTTGQPPLQLGMRLELSVGEAG